MATRVKWNGSEFERRLRSGMTKNVTAAAKALFSEVKQVLSKSGRTITTVISKSGKSRKVYGKYGGSPSAPGEPPHKQTGALIRGMFRKLVNKGKSARVGAKGSVSREYGTSKMKARPFLRPTLAKMKGTLAGILTRKIDV